MSYKFFNDDENHYGEYFFGDSLDNSLCSESMDQPQTVNYRYIQMCDVSKYGFNQGCFDNADIVPYFEFMKLLSTKSFNLLIDKYKRKWHLNISECKGNLQRAIYATIGKGKKLKPETTPTFFHFALYTSKGTANRATGIKSPRIYFFLGESASIYPVFYDPYHEINPMAK